ncbi:hypothetical protein Ndes2526B_g03797 [Nannochloris sp. 'desiccata']|nr:putative Outer dynein arm protein 1 [Chlorella desiccata (nom. nud.)]
MTRSESQSPTKPALNATTHVFRKQRAAMNALAADNRRLKEELMEENKYSADPTTLAGKKLIQNLESQDETYEALISEQQKAMDALLAKEADLRDALVSQRAAMGGINRALEVSVRAQRRVVLLENRVQQAAAARSGAELQAAKLKEKVDGLRREKKLFEELTSKMEADVTNKAREVGEILKKTMITHDARGKAEVMRAQVLNQAAKDAAASEAEWAQMTEVIESDRARREAAQAEKTAERARRMEELMAKQRAVASGRRQKPMPSAASTAGHLQLAGFPDTLHDTDTEASETLSGIGKPAERLSEIEAKLAAVVVGIADCHGAEHAVDLLSELKNLCFRLFASLTEAHTRLEALEDRVGQAQETTTIAAAAAAAAAALESASRAEEGPPILLKRQTSTRNAQLQGIRGLEEQLKLAEEQVQAVCTEVHHLCHRVRPSCPDIDAVLEREGAPTAGTLLMFIGMLEHWATASLYHYTSAPSIISSESGALSGGKKNFWAQHEDRSSDNGAVILLDPPSVGHRNSLSGRSSSSGSSRSAGGGWKKKGKPKRGGAHNRQSQATSESSDMSKIIDMEVLAQRAKRAVEMRLADATAVTVTATAHSLPQQQPCSD